MTPEQQKAIALANARKRMAETQAAPEASAQQLTRGDRFKQGMKDPFLGMGQLMLNSAAGITGNQTLKNAARGINNRLSDEETLYQQSRQAMGQDGIDWARLGGSITSTLPAAAVGRGATLLSAMGKGTLSGAALGLTNPVTDPNADFFQTKAEQAGFGAVAGGAVPAVMGAVSRIINPRSGPDVQKLLSEGISLTPGQVLGGTAKGLEDKLTSVPLLGDMINNARRRGIDDLNRVVLNRAVSPIGKTVNAVGNEGVDSVKDALSQAYDDVLPKLNLSITPELATDIGTIRNGIRKSIRPTFDEIFKKSVLSRLNGGAESELSKQAKTFSRSGNATEREIGEYIGKALGTLRTSLETQNHTFAPILQKINAGYGAYKTAANASAKDISGGVFTPAQLQRAVRQTSGSDKFAAGRAIMQDISQPAQNVMGGIYPDSGTAGRGMLALLLGGGATFNPTLAASGALALTPYTKLGGRLSSALLAQRPRMAGPLASGVNNISPAFGQALSILLSRDSTGGTNQ
jgi:hypothetical protein